MSDASGTLTLPHDQTQFSAESFRPLPPLLFWLPRHPRIVVPGFPHHVTQRGNQRQRVFFRNGDYQVYLDLLKRCSREANVAVEAYCLMPNHVHLILTPHEAPALTRLMQKLQSRYSSWLNTRLARTGHTWQSRFYAAPMEETHCWQAMVYAEQNPARAGLVPEASAWRWSSAQAHLTDREDGLLDLAKWRRVHGARQWQDCLELGLRHAALLARIRECTAANRPFGSENFLKRIESELRLAACASAAA